MELWVLFTLGAALFQTLRFMLQKQLSLGAITPMGSTFARFAYSVPFAWAVALGYLALRGAPFPALEWSFWKFAVLGGIGQIMATALVVALFQLRNFAVGITLKKTEVIQTALLGLIVLGDAVPLAGWAAIGLGLIGVLFLVKPGQGGGLAHLGGKPILLGIAAGFFFAVSGVGYRGATLAIASDDPFLRAAIALMCVTSFQALVCALWLRIFAKGQITAVWGIRKIGVWLGVTSLAGSIGWFTAFTLQTAAIVFAVGQVELIFSLMASVLFFREHVTLRELAGIALLAASIILLILMG